MNQRRLETAGEDWGPIFGPQCLLTSNWRMLNLLSELSLTVEVGQIKHCLRHSIAVLGGWDHRLGKVRSGCKRPIEARDFRYVAGYDQ